MSEKLTPLFAGDIPPVHEGVYERIYRCDAYQEDQRFSRWREGIWSIGMPTVEEAATYNSESCMQPAKNAHDFSWRGLTSPARMEAKK